MNYFNYFSQCDKKSISGKRADMKNMIALLVLLFVLAGGVYGYFAVQAARYRAQLDYLHEIKNNAAFMEQYSAAQKTAELLEEAKADYESIGLLSRAVELMNTANKELAYTLNDCMVTGSYISRISIANSHITLDGYAKNISMVATIEQNLRKSSVFQSIRISVIEDKEGSKPAMPKFTCLLVLKGGDSVQ